MARENRGPELQNILRANFENSINIAKLNIHSCESLVANIKSDNGNAILENLDHQVSVIKGLGIRLPTMIGVKDLGESTPVISLIEYDTNDKKLYRVQRKNPNPYGHRNQLDEDNLTKRKIVGTRQELKPEEYLEFGKAAFDNLKAAAERSLERKLLGMKKLESERILQNTFKEKGDLLENNLKAAADSIAEIRKTYGNDVRTILNHSLSIAKDCGLKVRRVIDLKLLSSDVEGKARIVHTVAYHTTGEKGLFDAKGKDRNIFFSSNLKAEGDKPKLIENIRLGNESYIDFGGLLADYLSATMNDYLKQTTLAN